MQSLFCDCLYHPVHFQALSNRFKKWTTSAKQSDEGQHMNIDGYSIWEQVGHASAYDEILPCCDKASFTQFFLQKSKWCSYATLYPQIFFNVNKTVHNIYMFSTSQQVLLYNTMILYRLFSSYHIISTSMCCFHCCILRCFYIFFIIQNLLDLRINKAGSCVLYMNKQSVGIANEISSLPPRPHRTPPKPKKILLI